MTKAHFDVDAFLGEDLRPAQVASVSPSGTPLLGSLWFLFDRNRFWFSSAQTSPFARAASRGAPVAVLVDDFHPPASIRQIRIRGRARIEIHDSTIVHRIYERYLGSHLEAWPPFFRTRVENTDGWILWSVPPDTGLAVTSPAFAESPIRWDRIEDSPLPISSKPPARL